MAGESAPAAAHVEQSLAGLEPQLAAHHVQLLDLGLVEIVVPIMEIRAGVDHLLVEPELVKGIRHVVVIGDVLLVLGGAAIALLFVADLLERPRAAARDEQKAGGGRRHQELADLLADVAGAHFGPSVDEVEKRAVLDVDAGRSPEIGERVETGLADEAGHAAFVGDGHGQGTRRVVRGDRRAIPEMEAKFQL